MSSSTCLIKILLSTLTLPQEQAKSALLVSHLYLLDHLVVSIAHYGFYQHYWYTVPHDGRRVINSSAQQALIDLAVSRGETEDPSAIGGDAARARLAEGIWASERVVALWLLFFGFVVKASRETHSLSDDDICTHYISCISSSPCTPTPHISAHRHTMPSP